MAYRATDMVSRCVVCKSIADEQCDTCSKPVCMEHHPTCMYCAMSEAEEDATVAMAAALMATEKPNIFRRETWIHPRLVGYGALAFYGSAMLGGLASMTLGLPILITLTGPLAVGGAAELFRRNGTLQRWSRRLFENGVRKRLHVAKERRQELLETRRQEALPSGPGADSD